MLVEIPDPEVILGVILAFLGGLFALYLFNKFNSLMKKAGRLSSSDQERLEFYEKQLIDMKIRLDSLQIGDSKQGEYENNQLKQISNQLNKGQQQTLKETEEKLTTSKKPKIDHGNTVDFVLELITEKEMTSRDIQIASHRSREHTSRLLNKLYKEGYVKRNTKTKPYTYSITEKGRAKLGVLDYLQNTTV